MVVADVLLSFHLFCFNLLYFLENDLLLVGVGVDLSGVGVGHLRVYFFDGLLLKSKAMFVAKIQTDDVFNFVWKFILDDVLDFLSN